MSDDDPMAAGDDVDDAAPGTDVPALPAAPPPPLADSVRDAVGRDAFLLKAGLIDAYFVHRSDTLAVTFDNLASIGEYDPPQPWLHARAAKAGVSILGLIATRKDWYRNPHTPETIVALRDAGLFEKFRRVVFVGTSMGGFAALTYARLVPGAAVLAFSPQSTLSRKLAPFDRRYVYAQKKWDWSSPACLDAADTARAGHEIYLVYDPMVPEDRQHAARLMGPNVCEIRVPYLGHRAIRQLKFFDLLQPLIEDVLAGRFNPLAFARAFRRRRESKSWLRGLFGAAEARGHSRLAARAAASLAGSHPYSRFLQRTSDRLKSLDAPRAAAPKEKKKSTGERGDWRARERVHKVAGPTLPGVFEGQILELGGAHVVPEREHDTPLASGVLRADGSYVEESRAWIRAFKSTPEPRLSADEPVVDLPGRHLFAGHFRGHFGHFLVESTARLWALDHIRGGVDSLLYLPYRGAVEPIERAIGGHEDFFRLLGIDVPVRTYGTTMRVERLFVPELGFGWRERYAGSHGYRAFMQGRMNAAVPAEGAEKLYISRARLNAQRGGVLGETVIEENLARAGFEIFHPERHPVATQIARYKAARTVVALDGSALHLAAYVLRPGSRVAMILRRSKANVADYQLQFRSFCGIDPDVIDVIRRDWIAESSNRVDFRSVGEIDFTRLFASLEKSGYVPRGFQADIPTETEIGAMLEHFAGRRGQNMRPLGAGDMHPDEQE